MVDIAADAGNHERIGPISSAAKAGEPAVMVPSKVSIRQHIFENPLIL
jgi:hypothetical protein